MGKMPSKAFPPTQSRAKAPFELIHSDLKEFPVISYHKYKYFISFLDDFTSHAWVIMLGKKSAAVKAIRQFTALVKNQYSSSIKRWWFDGGGEFKPFEEEMREMGILLEKSLPYEQQQNGRAERFNRTIMDKAQALRFDACLPDSWWEFSVEHALHLYNRTPLKRHLWKTPVETLTKEKPDVSHL